MGYSESTSLGNQTPTAPGRRTVSTPGGAMGRGSGRTRAQAAGTRMPGAQPGPTAGFPGRGSSYKGVSSPTVYGAPGGAPSTTGSESGPGILESWFNQRAAGTDPAYEYAMRRGGDSIDNRMAAGGSFNSGARGQQLSDFAANMGAQRMGQLDSLAGGASGEHMGRLGMMFQQGLGLAGGQAGLASAYDLGAAGNMDAANRAQQQMFLNKAGVDSQFNQGRANNLINAYAAYQSGGKTNPNA